MGNRAVIACSDKPDAVGIYLHWNGGRASVEGFLQACRTLGYRDPTLDESYGMARLCAAICAYFGLDGETSIGIGTVGTLDCKNGDNGLYILAPGWTIAERKYMRGAEEIDAEKTKAIARDTVNAVGRAAKRRAAAMRKALSKVA